MNKSALLVLLLASVSQAHSICRSYEYAELRDMPRADLERMYCDYHDVMLQTPKLALKEINDGRTRSAQAYSAIGERCAQELSRIERVLAKNGGKQPECHLPVLR